MKQFIIGRGDDCQIRLQDSSQRISRSHATLKIMDNGKIFITDHSSNGTFVNGVKISPNVDFPVKRGDSISFANAAELNWAQIPRSKNNLLFYIGGVIIVIGIGILLFLLINKPRPIPDHPVQKTDNVKIKKPEPAKVAKDSTNVKKKETPKSEPKKSEKQKPKDKRPAADTTKTGKKQPIIY